MSIVADEYENNMVSVLIKLVCAARDVVKLDGTDRLSIEALRDAVNSYELWLASEA